MSLTVGAICTAIAGVAKVLAVGGLALNALKSIVTTVVNLAKSLGVMKPEIKAEDLGDRSLQAESAGIKPENFNSNREYVEAVMGEKGYKFDPEKSKLYTEDEKLKRGASLAAGLIQETNPNLEVVGLVDALVKVADKGFGLFSEAGGNAFNLLVKDHPEYVNGLTQYIKGEKLDQAALDKAEEWIKTIEKAADPSQSNFDIDKKVADLRY